MLSDQILKSRIILDYFWIQLYLGCLPKRAKCWWQVLVRQIGLRGRQFLQDVFDHARKTLALLCSVSFGALNDIGVEAEREFLVHDRQLYVLKLVSYTSKSKKWFFLWLCTTVMLGATLVLPKGAEAQTLAQLYDTLAVTNPSVRAFDAEYAAALEERTIVDQLPDPEVSAAGFVSPVETRVGPQWARLGATQRIPWPGKLRAMATLADARARPILEQRAAEVLDLRYQLAQAYYALAALRARQPILVATLARYRSLEAVALARVEGGQAMSLDVYRIQLERQRLRQQLDELPLEAARYQARIEGLVGTELDSLVLPAIAQLAPAPLVDTSIRSALSQLDERNPRLRIYALQQSITSAALEVNRLAAKPDFAVGADYLLTGQRDDAEPPGNGRDAIALRAGIVIPLSRKQYAARDAQERLRLEANRQRTSELRNQLVARVEVALTDIAEARSRLAYLNEQMRVLDAALAVATEAYANGRLPFDELLRLENDTLRYELERLQSLESLLTTRAQLDKLLAL